MATVADVMGENWRQDLTNTTDGSVVVHACYRQRIRSPVKVNVLEKQKPAGSAANIC